MARLNQKLNLALNLPLSEKKLEEKKPIYGVGTVTDISSYEE